MAVPVIESSATEESVGAVTSITVAKPTGTASGDLLLALVSAGDNLNISAPAGFTEDFETGANVCGSDGQTVAAFWKEAGDSEPADYDFSAASSTGLVAALYRISGTDNSAPVNARADTTNCSGGDQSSPSVTTTVDDCLIFYGLTYPDTGATATEPSGTTRQNDLTTAGGNGTRQVNATKSQATAGSTGSGDWSGGPGASLRWTLAIAPVEPIVLAVTPATLNATGKTVAADLSALIGNATLNAAGQTVALDFDPTLTVGPATLNMTGQSVSLPIDVPAGAGAMTLNGQDVTLLADIDFVEPVVNGVLNLTGQPVGTILDTRETVVDGSITFTGQSVDNPLTAAVGNAALNATGQTATYGFSPTESVEDGTLQMTGQALTLSLATIESVANGALNVAGREIILDQNVPIVNSVLNFTGQDVGLPFAQTVQSGTMNLTSQGIEVFINAPIGNADIVLTNQTVTPFRVLVVENGALRFTPSDALIGAELEPIFHKSRVHLITPSNIVHFQGQEEDIE